METGEREISKADAALVLLERAIQVYLDHDDPVSAIVLAGSAEDVIEDLLGHEKRGHEAARRQIAAAVDQIVQSLDKSHAPVTPDAARGMMRAPFNWLRHSNRADDPQRMRWDFDQEARWSIQRAISNWALLSGDVPNRAYEFDQRDRVHGSEHQG